MLKISKLMLVSVLCFGTSVQAAEAVPTGDLVAKAVAQYPVPGFTREDIRFVREAYNTYLDAIKSKGIFTKTVTMFQKFDPVLVDYCNTLLSRFYRSQLVAMAKAAPSNSHILKEAIEVACKGIDQIGAEFVRISADFLTFRITEVLKMVQEQISQLRKNNMLQIALNAVDKYGNTALMEACYKSKSEKSVVETVQELLSIKDLSGRVLVDVNAVNNYGQTALQRACFRDSVEIIQMLLNTKDVLGKMLVDVNVADSRGDTALIAVCQTNKISLISILLMHGANILHKNNHGSSALTILLTALYTYEERETVRSILRVFDALKPDLTDEQLVGMSKAALELKKAYVEFQKGNPAVLSKLIHSLYIPRIFGKKILDQTRPTETEEQLLPSDVVEHLTVFRVPILETLNSIFQYDNIKPLLEWLIKVTLDQEVKNSLEAVLNEYISFDSTLPTVFHRELWINSDIKGK